MFNKDKFNPEKVRLIFLDIDGVLISIKSMIVTGYWANTCEDYSIPSGCYDGEHRLILKPPYVNHLESVDKLAVGLVNKLAESTDAYIILSSTWRRWLDMENIKLMLGAMGINSDRVIGKTSYSGGTRGDQIWNFIQGLKERRIGELGDFFVNRDMLIDELEGVPMTLDSYVILDDVNAFRPEQQAKFVKVSEDEGLTLEDALIAGSMLTGKDFTIPMLKHGEDTERRLITVRV